jgi:RNA polymerase sigma factor (sigma-70 family)
MKPLFSDAIIIEHIKAGGAKRQKAISLIYKDKKLKNQIVQFVANNSGSQDEGIDIFHEGIIAFDANVRNNKYKGTGKLKGYLYATCRFLWLNRLKRDKKMVYTSENSELDQVSLETPEHLSMKEEQKEIIHQLLSRLGEKCQKILELWKLSYSMEEIAVEAGLKNAGVARRQRYNCYQKLLQEIDKKPNLRNVLK